MLQSHKSAEKDTHWNIICTNTHYATENVFFYALLLRTIYYLLICLFSIILYVIWSNLISSHSFHILSIHFYCYHCFFFSFIISFSNQGQDGNVDQITEFDQVLGDLEDDDYNMLSNLQSYVVN